MCAVGLFQMSLMFAFNMTPEKENRGHEYASQRLGHFNLIFHLEPLAAAQFPTAESLKRSISAFQMSVTHM